MQNVDLVIAYLTSRKQQLASGVSANKNVCYCMFARKMVSFLEEDEESDLTVEQMEASPLISGLLTGNRIRINL
jgi:hypothetical protein